jgi:molybdopterin molybdotransferase
VLSYQQARKLVISRLTEISREPQTESVPLLNSPSRILASDILSDRDYPPFDRSIRDGYAVRAEDTRPGARLRCIGEIRAGEAPSFTVSAGTCVQIMTGAPLPEGADAVVMVEHTSRDGDSVQVDRAVGPGQHVVRRGSEQKAGGTILAAGTRFGFAELAVAAQVGAANLAVTRKPRIAILTTGDEVVDFASAPGPFQIRNSNSVSLAAQVSLCCAEPVLLGNATDSLDDLREKISAGLEADMLILSGGVSMGKYDLVEPVLREFGADFIFDAVAIRPGKPVVFATCNGKSFDAQGKPFEPQSKPIFGLPGNPVSTMVTFDLFVRPAIEILSGELEVRPLPFFEAELTIALSEKPGLTHFLPAKLGWQGDLARVAPIPWQGSGDVVAMAQANCLLVVPAERERIEAGERVRVLPRGVW